MHVMKREEAEDAPDMAMGTFSIHSYTITVLFDSGASHSFVAPGIIDKLKLVISLGSLCLQET